MSGRPTTPTTDHQGRDMPTYDTPQPISARLALGFVVANIRVTASERTDTQVDVRPVDETSKADVRVFEQTKVEYADGTLEVRAPMRASVMRQTGVIDVTVALPEGSDLRVESGMGEILCEGAVGDCRLKSGYGDIRLDQARTAVLRSAGGDITVGEVDGRTEINVGNGTVDVRRIGGPATVKNSNGATRIGEVTGDLAVNGANGAITVDRAHAGVTAKTANGSIRIGEVARGAVGLQTAAGTVEIGVRPGTAAWLDLDTTSGRVRNELTAATAPEEADDTVEVRARTHVGDIVVHYA
jgi:DUF4097 and DUF4098 domain-containing protein YvlB